MCGLAGIYLPDGATPDRALLARMNDALTHRGPDEAGLHLEPGVGLAHRRLSIIDIATGQQPLFNEDGSVVVVFNGEIYNFAELAQELAALGHVFCTHSDTEVIVHAWEQWGDACVTRFRGMFAFALWDRNQHTLFLARDRLGIKPLYYARLPDGALIFASELKSLLLYPGLKRTLDVRAVEDYFAFGYVPEPRTIFSTARKLEPGHTLCVNGSGAAEPRRYWDVPFALRAHENEADAQVELIERLREAVRIRLISEVPLGAFLSGGVDSSAIVALMAQVADGPVNTCSISFGESDFDESEHAAAVARQYHTRHSSERVASDDFDLVDGLATLYDEPFADSSALPTWRVCQLARRRVTVALSGDGGDENFAGYRRYRFHLFEERLRSALPSALRRPLFGALGRLYPKLDWAPRVLRGKSTFQSLARDTLEGYLHNVGVVTEEQRARLFSAQLEADLQGYRAVEVLRRHAAQAPTDHPLSLVQYLDLKTYLAGDILTKVDRASMAHALEVRVPILDHPFVEWVSGLPPEFKLRDGMGKRIFKRALEPYLSKDILYRPKMGFAVPLSDWFRGPLRERLRRSLLDGVLSGTGLFDMGFIRRVVDEHQSSQREHSALLWSLLMFERWQEKVGNG
jgi:asparagine synthase (glutamine-hydrolysing)